MTSTNLPQWKWAVGMIALACAAIIMTFIAFGSVRACLTSFTILGLLSNGLALVVLYFPFIFVVSAIASVAAASPRKANHWPAYVGIALVLLTIALLISTNRLYAWLAFPIAAVPFGYLIGTTPISPRNAIALSLIFGIIAGCLIFSHTQYNAAPCTP